ncbi:MAG: NusG domain II-containing protein [Lachnospiraceae bacterium]|nr:NusG domain II-containing protein [Lachnospiraceae bacterium]
MHKYIGRNDIILMASILAVSVLIMISSRAFADKGTTAAVYVDGTETGRYPLTDDINVDIDGYGGSHNTLAISGGKAYMSYASCPDKLCMHQGKVYKGGQTIVCLPNRVIIKIEGENDSGYDAITR